MYTSGFTFGQVCFCVCLYCIYSCTCKRVRVYGCVRMGVCVCKNGHAFEFMCVQDTHLLAHKLSTTYTEPLSPPRLPLLCFFALFLKSKIIRQKKYFNPYFVLSESWGCKKIHIFWSIAPKTKKRNKKFRVEGKTEKRFSFFPFLLLMGWSWSGCNNNGPGCSRLLLRKAQFFVPV